jgi:hypothetical protein
LRHLDELGEGAMGKSWNGDGRSLDRTDRPYISKRSRPTCQTQNKNKSQTAGVRPSDDYNNQEARSDGGKIECGKTEKRLSDV